MSAIILGAAETTSTELKDKLAKVTIDLTEQTLIIVGIGTKYLVTILMSQTELARKAGLSQAHIAKIESGKVDPRFSTVERILRCLKDEEKDQCSKYMLSSA